MGGMDGSFEYIYTSGPTRRPNQFFVSTHYLLTQEVKNGLLEEFERWLSETDVMPKNRGWEKGEGWEGVD